MIKITKRELNNMINEAVENKMRQLELDEKFNMRHALLGAGIMGAIAGGPSCRNLSYYDEPEYDTHETSYTHSLKEEHDNYEIIEKRSPYSNCKGQLYCISYYFKDPGSTYPKIITAWVDEDCYNRYEVGDIFDEYNDWPTKQTGYNY